MLLVNNHLLVDVLNDHDMILLLGVILNDLSKQLFVDRFIEYFW